MVEVSIPTAAPATNLSSSVSVFLTSFHSTILPSDHEHSHVDSRRLENTSNQRDDRTCSDSPLATKAIGDDHVNNRAQDSTALEGRDDTSSSCAVGIVEVLDKLRKGDDTSDDTRVITKQEASDGEEGTRQDDCCFSHDC